MDVRVGLWRRQSAEELMLLNCGVGEGSWEYLGPQGKSNQSIPKEINPEYSSEGLMLKLKLQYFAHLMWRTDTFEKTLILGKIEGSREGDDRGWDCWMASPAQWTWVCSGRWWWRGRPGVRAAVHGVAKSQTRLHNWTELIPKMSVFTFAITCFTFSNLRSLLDLTFHVSMKFFFYIALNFTLITSHIHNWVLFLLWLSLYTPGAISPLFFSNLWDTYWPKGLSFSVISFCLFILFMRLSREEC